MQQGHNVIFQDKEWDEVILHIAEVLEVDRHSATVQMWYYLQNIKGSYNWYAPMKRGGYVPEWVDHTGGTRLAPKVSEIADLAKRIVIKSPSDRSDIHIIVPKVEVQTGGKVPASDLELVDQYLREAAAINVKALRALNNPTDEEKQKADKGKKKRKAVRTQQVK